MSFLIEGVEAEFGTDFAILSAGQSEVEFSPGTSFATSVPGYLSLECGTKFATVHIRAERWTDRPPLIDGWQDMDELPFVEVSGAGKLMLSGFDLGDVGLDVDGLGRGRVQVFARGRHRYSYNSDSDVEAMVPEEWLLRFFPLDGPIDPMAGGPRRIAGEGEGGMAVLVPTPWRAALLGFRTSGWEDLLFNARGFSSVRGGLWRAGTAVTRVELASLMARGMPPWELGGPDSESIEFSARADSAGLDELEELVGGVVSTLGEAIDAMVSVGLLVVEERAGERMFIPNPSPMPAWERSGMTDLVLVRARARALGSRHREIGSDIAAAVAWLPDEGLTATPRAMALRWSTNVDDVVGGIRMLTGSGSVRSNRELGFDVELEADETIALWPARSSAL